MKLEVHGAVNFYDYRPQLADFYTEVVDGLSQTPKALSPKYFYDEIGSKLFDEICELSEYYLTRTETALLKACAQEITALVDEGCLLVEPGSGSSNKVRLLLNALKPHAYLPMDISRKHLLASAESLSMDYPWLRVHAACVDFSEPLELPYSAPGGKCVAFFPGSTIGNFSPEGVINFLANVADMVGQGGGLLIGVDLKKDASILRAAYNDKKGVTARFNLNMLRRINDELGADFDLDQFRHWAYYNEDDGRIEMHLVSCRRQMMTLGSHQISFEEGETIHTENSYKYALNEFRDLAREAGLERVKAWTDPLELFSVQYFVR